MLSKVINRAKLKMGTISFLLLSLISVSAQSYTCAEILYESSQTVLQKLNTPLTRPNKGNVINTEGLNNWIEAHRGFGADYYELAGFLASNIQMITQVEFEESFARAMKAFLESLSEGEEYFLLITEEKGKGQYWVARIMMDLFPDSMPKDILIEPSKEEFMSYIAKNPQSVPLIVDDAMYGGQGVEEGIASYVPKEYLSNDNVVNVVLAASTNYAKGSLRRRYPSSKVFFGFVMSSFGEHLSRVSDMERRNRLSSAFDMQYGDFTKEMTITGFAHKTADMASVVGMSSDDDCRYIAGGCRGEYGTTVLEGALIGPDNLIRGTIPILHTEEKPY